MTAAPPATTRATTFVTADELERELAGDRPPRLLDVRWSLDDPDGRTHYAAGHLPGAVYADLETELTGPGPASAGRHPLPTLAALQRAARGWGLDDGDAIVVYDAGPALAAARAWWLLRWAGVSSVRILDGGLAAWRDAGLAIGREDVAPPAGSVTLAGQGLPTVDAEGAAGWPGPGRVLLDARAADRYTGATEPVDPRAGHIPGARSAPTAGNVGPDGRFLSAEELRDRFAALGVEAGTRVAVYCGSGVTAAHQIAALASLGIEATLFPPSWSGWSSDPARPVATGPRP